ncbi:MAG: hypothetical protein H6684_09135 [Deltaproteobacteria bacterium]|nr:hypothetical protein [Deltaproteobacteria bacterium]
MPAEDIDDNDIPDFVEFIALSLGDAYQAYVDAGFLPPVDDALYNDGDSGGDSRVDAYLVDMVDSDGFIVSEVHPEDTPRFDAAGYLTIENDFAGFGYPDLEYAMMVLASHELFHLVQGAYDTRQSTWWTEGGAEWATELVYPDLNEWMHFVPAYFNSAHESLRSTTAIASARPYGAVVWPLYLTERFGVPAHVAIWEDVVTDTEEYRDALVAARDYLDANAPGGFDGAFAEFAWWCFLTGDRVGNDEGGFADAATMPPLASSGTIAPDGSTWDFPLEASAFAHFEIAFDAATEAGRQLVLNRAKDADGDIAIWWLTLVDGRWRRDPVDASEAYTVPEGASAMRLLAVNASLGGEAALEWTLRLRDAPDDAGDDADETDDDVNKPTPSGDSDSDDGGCGI